MLKLASKQAEELRFGVSEAPDKILATVPWTVDFQAGQREKLQEEKAMPESVLSTDFSPQHNEPETITVSRAEFAALKAKFMEQDKRNHELNGEMTELKKMVTSLKMEINAQSGSHQDSTSSQQKKASTPPVTPLGRNSLYSSGRNGKHKNKHASVNISSQNTPQPRQ